MTGSSIIDVTADPEQVSLGGGDGAAFTHRSFVTWLLVGTITAIAAIGVFNWVIDPTGVTGRMTRWRIADNAEVRTQKLDLYETAVAAAPPKVVLIGSSRVMKFNPRDVQELTGQRAFNASVSGGVPRDAWLFTQLMAERQPGAGAFPHLVWGLDVDAFRDKQLRDGLSTDPRMSRFLPRSERITTKVAAAGTLTELQTLKASIRSIQRGGRGDAAARRVAAKRYGADGFQRWSLPFPRNATALDRAVRRQIAQYAGFIFERDAFDGIEQQPLDEFREVIRIANDNGDVPTIFLTPYHPTAQRVLERYAIEEREREVRAQLRELQDEGELRFEVVDLTRISKFGGDPSQFYDGVHMTPANTRRVLTRIDEAGLLAPPD